MPHFSEPLVRLLAFGVIFSAIAIFELVSPRLERDEMRGALKSRRWVTNLSILLLSSLALRIIFPLAAVGTALWASSKGYGLFNAVPLPAGVAGILSFVILDFAIWLEHVASHKVPLFWRFHRMHHADTGFDVTTALRFHPAEILVSMLWKAAIITLIGAPAFSVLIFEVVLNGTSMFNHANIGLPKKMERRVRAVIVTPDMHRIHHSIIRLETDSNYGFNFSFWDRLFRTYNDRPAAGETGVEIGLPAWRDTAPSGLLWSLLLPFRK